MRFTTKQLLVITMFVAALLAVSVAVKSAIKPRIVVSVDHPNGARLRVVQTFSLDDLFNTSIYFNDGDGRWRWYYFDHDDWYWGSADFQIVDSQVDIRSGNRMISFNVETGECKIASREVGDRTSSLSQDFRPLPRDLVEPTT